MWTRAAASRCVSLRTLRNRSGFSICASGQTSRQYRRGYRNSCVNSSPLPSASKRSNGVLGCLGQHMEDEHNQKYSDMQQMNVSGKQEYKEMQLHSPNRAHFKSRESEPLYSEPESLVRPLCSALNEARSALQSHGRIAMTKRSFSTSDDPSKKGDSSTPDEQRTEPDFADYLAGKTDEEATKSALDTEPIPAAEAPIDLEGTDVPLDDHTETYKYIRRSQQNSWELAREKTTENVQRALAGNVAICAAKLAAYISSGSSSMFSEFIHSVVDCGNQSLLLLGLRDAGNRADRKHPYGYGKSIYFYALVSALGTFFLGAGVSGTQAWGELMEPSLSDITWQVWSVLGFSFVVDGYVLSKTVIGIRESIPKGAKMRFWSYVQTIRDPATLAVLLEDGAACLGIVIATAGIAASSSTGMPVFDGLAGLAISGLLASMGLVLVRINQRFLLGQAVDPEITKGIERILLSQRSIDGVHSIQSQWTGPDSFSFKAEVDFDGTYLAAKLMPRYQHEFLQVRDTLDQELRVLLSWYAEDVMRTVEREVRHVEAEIRKSYPAAEFIELEPMSKDADRFAVDDGMQAQLRRIEIESLNRYLRSLYQPGGSSKSKSDKGGRDETNSSDEQSPNKQ